MKTLLFPWLSRALIALTTIAGLSLTAPAPAAAVVAHPPAAPPAPAADYPAGFVAQRIATPISNTPFDLNNIHYVPESTGVQGGYLGVGKTGRIIWVPESGGGSVLATVSRVKTRHDAGLLAGTPSHDYSTTGRFYILYPQLVGGHAYAMVESWLVNSPAAPTSAAFERVVVDGSELNGSAAGLTNDSLSHMTGDIMVWPDGTIFFSNGDDASFTFADPLAFRSQDPADPHGKVFRVNPDGSGVSDNPFYRAADPDSWASRVYSLGLRNPYRLWRDPITGAVMGVDVGWNNVESVLIHSAGANHGWPCWEGEIQTPGYGALPDHARWCRPGGQPKARTPALHTYPHRGGASVTGGTVYMGSSYPAQYRGATFWGDYTTGKIMTLRTDGARLTGPAAGFASSVGVPTAVRSGPAGDIVWADIGSSSIVRLRYSAQNNAPIARFTSVIDRTTRTVTFDAGESQDPDRDRITYAWNFGDGTAGTGAVVRHTFPADAEYTVTLTVTDSLGARGTFTQTITPAHTPPVLTIEGTTSEATYAVGDVVTLQATATDTAGAVLDPTAIRWTVVLSHCPSNGACHAHPFAEATGASVSLTFPDHGGDTHMSVRVTSPPDSRGETTTRELSLLPRMRTLSVAAPPSTEVSLNGIPAGAARVVAGSTNLITVSADSEEGTFLRWDDGVASRSRTVVMPDADTTFVAIYETPIARKYRELGEATGVLGAPLTGEYTVAGGGRAQDFANGSIVWLAAGGIRLVNGQVLRHFRATGGFLRWGLPKNDETAITGGRRQDFALGSFFWSSRTGTRAVWGSILAKYLSAGGPAMLGFPTTDELPEVRGGRVHVFTNGRIYYSRATGAHVVAGAILAKYLAVNGPLGSLGYPTTDEAPGPHGSRSTTFGTRGMIITSATTGTHEVYGAIFTHYSRMGGRFSRLRLPTSGEYAISGGRRSDFQGGSIIYNSRTGAIRVVYR